MQIHSLISKSVQQVNSQAILALADSQVEPSDRDVLLQVADKIQEVEQLIASGSLTTVPGANAMKPAVFIGKRIDGSIHVGWHHTKVETVAGDLFHYDHGVGIERNKDGQYIWFPPITGYVNFTYNAETNSFDGDWEPCHADTNSSSNVSVYERVLTKALEAKIETRPKIVYVTLSNPVDVKKPIEVRRFELGY
jgi:hypothetical protein